MRSSIGFLFLIGGASLLLVACDAAVPAPANNLGAGPGGLEVTVVPLAPDFAAAEVTILVDGVECARRTMSRAQSRWLEERFCSRSENRADLQFLAPTACLPGGVFLYEGAAALSQGGLLTYRDQSVAAWDASGQGLHASALDLERNLVLMGHGGAAGDAGTTKNLRSWSYHFEYLPRAILPGCSEQILLELEATPASAELPAQKHLYSVDTALSADGTDAILEITRQGQMAPLPWVEVRLDGEWKTANQVSSTTQDQVAFALPENADRELRLLFDLDALLAMQVVPRIAYEPREEIPAPYWFEFAEPANAFIRVEEPISMVEEAAGALALAEHLSAFLAELTSSLPADHAPPATLGMSVSVSLAASIGPGLPEIRTPLFLAPAITFIKGESDRGACEEGPSVACELAAMVSSSLDANGSASGSGDESGTLIFEFKLFGTSHPDPGPIIELREVRLPLDRIER